MVAGNLPTSNYAIINGIARIAEMGPAEGAIQRNHDGDRLAPRRAAAVASRIFWIVSGPRNSPPKARQDEQRAEHAMSERISTYVVGAYEHPIRRADGISSAKLHADVAHGALADAGLTIDDVDGYFCGADAPGLGPVSMAEYLGLRKLRYMDSTETGGSSYIVH